MTRILMMSERRVIGRTPIFVIKYRTWRPRRTNQVAMSASNNRRAILVLFMTATQGAPNHHIRPRIGDFRADLEVKLGPFAAWEPHSPKVDNRKSSPSPVGSDS